MESLTREKTYMASNMFLKFSKLVVLDDEERPFSTNYGATGFGLLANHQLYSANRVNQIS
jgi:hypothetical protein